MLVRTTDTVKKYFPQTTVDDFAIFEPHIQTAEEKYVIPYLGKATSKRLNDYMDAGAMPGESSLDGLLPLVQRAVVDFAYRVSVPVRNVVDTNDGFGVVQNSNLAPASSARTDELKAGVDEYGWNAIDVMLQYLEENRADFPEWYHSAVSTLAFRNLINNATEFGQYVHLPGFSRVAFQQLRPVMDNVEMLIISQKIGDDVVSGLKTKMKEDTLTPDDEKVLTLLQRALANLALSENVPIPDGSITFNITAIFNITDVARQKYHLIGMEYLNRAIKINSELNPSVLDPNGISQHWENKPSNKIFVGS
jgi:hypothetical protein